MDEKRRKPVAVCTNCGDYSRNVTAINQRCSKKINGKRCNGVYGSALTPNDWEECPSCNATGRERGNQCSQCEDEGWIFVRKGR